MHTSVSWREMTQALDARPQVVEAIEGKYGDALIIQYTKCMHTVLWHNLLYYIHGKLCKQLQLEITVLNCIYHIPLMGIYRQ